MGPIRLKSPKYRRDLSGLQTPEPSARFRFFHYRKPRAIAPQISAVKFRGPIASEPALLALLMAAVLLSGCDHGLTPPPEPERGFIRAVIEYEGGASAWPPRDSLRDLRFVAMRFVPRDTTDLLNLNQLVFSDRLEYNVGEQDLTLSGIEAGPFLYAGVAQQFGTGTFEWRPVGIVTENDGLFVVAANETTNVHVSVDFYDPPPFPPPLP